MSPIDRIPTVAKGAILVRLFLKYWRASEKCEKDEDEEAIEVERDIGLYRPLSASANMHVIREDAAVARNSLKGGRIGSYLNVRRSMWCRVSGSALKAFTMASDMRKRLQNRPTPRSNEP
jgi:hypothetical protein